jgi:hypothetical protein
MHSVLKLACVCKHSTLNHRSYPTKSLPGTLLTSNGPDAMTISELIADESRGHALVIFPATEQEAHGALRLRK